MSERSIYTSPVHIRNDQAALTQINLDTFPTELQDNNYPFWLLWKPTPNNIKSPNKPCDKLLKLPTDPQWQKPSASLSFDAILQSYQKKTNLYESHLEKLKDNPRHNIPIPVGFGFKYTEEHPFICFDIDAPTDENKELIDTLNSYTEWSPSDNGLHTVVSVISLDVKKQLIEMFGKGIRRTSEKRDLFIASGYVTITGKLYPITPREVRTLGLDEITGLINKYFMPTNVIKHPARIEEELEHAKQTVELRKESVNTKPVAERSKALSPAQVKNLLRVIPVQCLESDIFIRLQSNELAIINLECEEEAREPWLIIGQALHHNFNGGVEGYFAWDQWSKEGNKYDADALEATWKSFKDLAGSQSKPVTIGALIKLAMAQRPTFPDKNKNGLPLATNDNFHAYIDFFKIKCRLNEITKSYKVDLPNYVLNTWNAGKVTLGSTLSLDQISNNIRFDFNKLGFPVRGYSDRSIQTFLTIQGLQNQYNPVRDYFKECGENWDGKDYISSLVNTITVAPRYISFESSIHAFIRKWLIQVTAAACHDIKQPVRLNRVLIFSGPQDIGKTMWVSSIFPKAIRKYCMADKQLQITTFKNESTKQAMELQATLIVNINEIDQQFNEKTFSTFKSFLDQTIDKLVLPYGKEAIEMNRRCVFIGSTNSENFLRDMTGNRRFEVVPTIKLDHKHTVDLEQLWGQVYNIWKGGEKWWFDETVPSEAKVIKARDIINSQSMYLGDEAFLDTLDRVFNTDYEGDEWKRMRLIDVRQLTGLSNLTTNSKPFIQAKDTLARWSKEVTGKDSFKEAGKRPRIWYYMPPLRLNEDPLPPEEEDMISNDVPPDETEEIIKQMKLLKKKLFLLNKKKTQGDN